MAKCQLACLQIDWLTMEQPKTETDKKATDNLTTKKQHKILNNDMTNNCTN